MNDWFVFCKVESKYNLISLLDTIRKCSIDESVSVVSSLSRRSLVVFVHNDEMTATLPWVKLSNILAFTRVGVSFRNDRDDVKTENLVTTPTLG